MDGIGRADAFLVKLDNLGTSLEYGTYLGESQGDGAYDIEFCHDGTVFLLGGTYSDDLPTHQGAFCCTWMGKQDLFVMRLDGSLKNLLNCTYLGGTSYDGTIVFGDSVSYLGIDLSIGTNGVLCIGGLTNSTDFQSPVGPSVQHQKTWITRVKVSYPNWTPTSPPCYVRHS